MAFDLKPWLSQGHTGWAGHGPRLKVAPTKSAYAMLTAHQAGS